jgi:hypothetical protein
MSEQPLAILEFGMSRVSHVFLFSTGASYLPRRIFPNYGYKDWERVCEALREARGP